MSQLKSLTPVAVALSLALTGLAHAAELPVAPPTSDTSTTTTKAPDAVPAADSKAGDGKCGAKMMKPHKGDKPMKPMEGKCGGKT